VKFSFRRRNFLHISWTIHDFCSAFPPASTSYNRILHSASSRGRWFEIYLFVRLRRVGWRRKSKRNGRKRPRLEGSVSRIYWSALLATYVADSYISRFFDVQRLFCGNSFVLSKACETFKEFAQILVNIKNKKLCNMAKLCFFFVFTYLWKNRKNICFLYSIEQKYSSIKNSYCHLYLF